MSKTNLLQKLLGRLSQSCSHHSSRVTRHLRQLPLWQHLIAVSLMIAISFGLAIGSGSIQGQSLKSGLVEGIQGVATTTKDITDIIGGVAGATGKGIGEINKAKDQIDRLKGKHNDYGLDKIPGCGGGNCLLMPGTEQYGAISKETSLRQSIISWTNFFLGFLGLIAMIMLILAGFMYVTAHGEDDQVGKAKKIITYVTIGIIVILLARAYVTTLLVDGPAGSDLKTNVIQSQNR